MREHASARVIVAGGDVACWIAAALEAAEGQGVIVSGNRLLREAGSGQGSIVADTLFSPIRKVSCRPEV